MLKDLNLSENAPWRQRFRAPVVSWSNIAAQNPQRGIVCTNQDGIYQLYAWEVDSGKLTQITRQPAGVVQGTISADGNWIYYLHDAQGNEIGHYYRVPFAGGEPEDLTPTLPDYASFYFTESYSGNFYGFTAANQDGFQMFVVDSLRGGTPHLRYQSQALSTGPFLAYDAEIGVIATTEKSGTTEFSLEAYDIRTGEKLGELWDGVGTGMFPIGFAQRAHDMRFVAATNASGFFRPLIWNVRSNERHDLDLPIEGEISPMDWSKDGEYLLLHQLYQAQHQLYRYHLPTNTLQKLNHPAGNYSAGYFSGSGTIFIHLQDSVSPARLVELDGTTGELKRTVLAAGNPPIGERWRSVTFTSGDGTPLQAWLVTPAGKGPFPTIVHTHGGPTAVTTETYAPGCQAWVEHGFAWFSINYRGSTTFGKDFEKAIHGNLGELEVEDIAAGVRWLIENGVAQPDAILKTGGSYGGYLTLLSLGKKPELWAGGMALVAIADWTMLYEDEAETLKGYQRALFGGTPDEMPEQYAKSSPVTYAAQVKAPLLVIQGKNDTRCPARQMEVYEAKLNEMGKSIYVDWFDAGHGSRAMEQQIHQMETMLRFAYRVLG